MEVIKERIYISWLWKEKDNLNPDIPYCYYFKFDL